MHAEIVETELQVLQPRAQFALRILNSAFTDLRPLSGLHGTAALAGLLAFRERIRSATSVPTGRSATTMWVSVRSVIFTGRGSKERPRRMNTTGLPSCSKSA